MCASLIGKTVEVGYIFSISIVLFYSVIIRFEICASLSTDFIVVVSILLFVRSFQVVSYSWGVALLVLFIGSKTCVNCGTVLI